MKHPDQPQQPWVPPEPPGVVWRLVDRLRVVTPLPVRLTLKRHLPSAVCRYIAQTYPRWNRAVLVPDARRTFEELGPESLSAAEVSGRAWHTLPWRLHTNLDFPEFDLCTPSESLPGPFDVVICEQVLEHVKDPLTAVGTLRRLCKPNGHVFVSTPFLIRLHDSPGDYWRYTPAGLGRLLLSQGLEPVWVRSWGNREVIVANLDHWALRRWPWQTLRNEPHLPVQVWALARPL
jgi:hypothetical protein